MSRFRNSALINAPTSFSYTPTGRAVPTTSPMRAPGLHTPGPVAPSCTPTGRVVLATPAARGAA